MRFSWENRCAPVIWVDRPIPAIIPAAPLHRPPRAGDVRHSRADIGRACRDLGYQPAVSFEEGLGRTLRWYRESQAGGTGG